METVTVKKSDLDLLIAQKNEAIEKLNELIIRDTKIFKQVKLITNLIMDKNGNFDPGNIMSVIMDPSTLQKFDTVEFKEAFQFIMNHE